MVFPQGLMDAWSGSCHPTAGKVSGFLRDGSAGCRANTHHRGSQLNNKRKKWPLKEGATPRLLSAPRHLDVFITSAFLSLQHSPSQPRGRAPASLGEPMRAAKWPLGKGLMCVPNTCPVQGCAVSLGQKRKERCERHTLPAQCLCGSHKMETYTEVWASSSDSFTPGCPHSSS